MRVRGSMRQYQELADETGVDQPAPPVLCIPRTGPSGGLGHALAHRFNFGRQFRYVAQARKGIGANPVETLCHHAVPADETGAHQGQVLPSPCLIRQIIFIPVQLGGQGTFIAIGRRRSIS